MTRGLRACLELVLGPDFGPLPEPEGGDELRFWRQWLGGRNLGLVPVADPDEFAWAGHWLALVGEHGDAVVMFGSPSGPIFDPGGAWGGPVREAYVVAPLDVHLDRERPYGEPAGHGTVEAVLLAPFAEASLVRVDSARAIAGRGLEGDRYAAGQGTFGGGKGYDLTLIEAEALEALAAEHGIDLTAGEARRNVVTRGIALNALVGRRFRVGEVECRAERLAEPCSHLEQLTRPGVLRGLVHRAGIRADVLSDGEIGPGDPVVAL